MVFGVAGGLGEYFQLDPSVVRMILVVLVLSGGLGLWLYLILALLVPSDKGKDQGNKVKPIGGEGKEVGIGRRNIFGWLIILLGVTAILNQLMPGFWRWDIFWPLTMITLGAYLILK